MANTISQAQQIKELLVEKIEAFDPTLNTSQGSGFYTQVIEPVFAALSVDPFDTDIEEFLVTRLRQEYPSIPAESGDAIVDLLVRPLQLLLESFKRELQIIRTGQSVRTAANLRTADAEDLAANFFVTRRAGTRSSGVVRLYFRQPTFVSVPVTAAFRTTEGLQFFPTIPQFFRPETVAVQRSGDLYFVDVTVLAETEGEEYNVEVGAITVAAGITGVARVTNLFEFGGGSVAETGEQLLSRTRSSLTERSFVTRRGIRARLFDEFTAIRNMEVVGYGDPEMQRDKITGGGGMDNLCSGMCFIVGRYAMLFTMFEDTGSAGDRFLKAGGVLDLNFWKFLYNPTKSQVNQRFTVESVIYNSNEDLENIPTVYLVKLDSAPDIEAPVTNAIPGVLPGVFFTAYVKSTITISNIPGGITNPDEDGLILVEDGEVHIGGHYDVYIRPSSSNVSTVSIPAERSESPILEGSTLVTSGEILTDLQTEGALSNKVHARFRLHLVPFAGTLTEGEIVQRMTSLSATPDSDTGALLLAFDSTDNHADLACLTEKTDWADGDYVKGVTSGAIYRISSIERTLWADLGVKLGMTLNIINGPDTGVYKILDVRGPELILDLEMTVTGSGYQFRVTDDTIVDAFEPRSVIFPFGSASASDLNTVIGVPTVTVSQDLSVFGVRVGDSLEILEGDNKGSYTISGFDETLGSRAPVLDRPLRSTDSGLSYQIFRGGTGLTLPLVRISPGGVSTIDITGQPAGFTVPPAEAVGARAYQAFSGARASYLGLNGFVLPDPGPSWMPSTDTVIDRDQLEADGHLSTIEQYYGAPGDCYSQDCLPHEDAFIAVVTIVDMPTSSGGHDVRVLLDLDLPTAATDFLGNLRTWLTQVVDKFELGDDFRSLIDLFAPISLKDFSTVVSPSGGAVNIIAQYEVLIPKEIFDGCNNVFVAIPEYNWTNEFGDDITFQDAMDKYNNGELKGGKPALTKAEPGGALTILSGANAGSYVIKSVYRYSLVNGASINTADTDGVLTDDYIDKSKMFEVVLICIEDSFPVTSFSGLPEYFDEVLTSPGTALSLPTPPAFNVESIIRSGTSAGTVVGPWEVVQQAVTWLFQFLSSAGFDVPEEFVVNPDSVLKKITQSLFVDYVVGNTTCEQIVRMNFLEPTSVTVYGNRSCESYVWYDTTTTAATITGDAITLPLTASDGLPVTIHLTTIKGIETITGTITSAISGSAVIADVISLLQELLDPDAARIVVSGGLAGLTFTTVEEGADVSLRVDASASSQALFHMGFDASDTTVYGTSAEGTKNTEYLHPAAPTLFSAVAGSAELLFTATGTEEPFQVFPGQTSSGRVAKLDLPRDMLLSAHFTSGNMFRAVFTDLTKQSPLLAGVQRGKDILRIYEQRRLLEMTGTGAEPVPEKRDRVIAVTTTVGSAKVSLPKITTGATADFTFLSAASDKAYDEVVPGDLLFIEEGDDARGYIVQSVSDQEIVLDRVLKATTPSIYASGNEGAIDSSTTFVDLAASFTSEDVGRYLTIFASNYEGVDGSYQITSVTDASTVVISHPSSAFPVTETGIHWVVVKAPVDALDSSAIDGVTELHGVVPVRVYNSVATEWRVADLNPTVNRGSADLDCTYKGAKYPADNPEARDLTFGPIRGYKQPYEIVRSKVVRISSTAMRQQGREDGLYYFDVRAKSLGGDSVYNIPKDAALTPIFGTYESDGYRLTVSNPDFSFSMKEEGTKIRMSSRFLPSTLQDVEANKVSVEGLSFNVTHEYSAVVAGVQTTMLSAANRVLCADPLARHFLPSYVYFDVAATGGTAAMGQAIYDHIDSLEPEATLDISVFEKFLHQYDVTSYAHPLTVQIVTHDLDRKAVLTRSNDSIGNASDEADFNGTHRTTFYIPGDVTTADTESDILDGERIYIKRRQ